MKYTTKVKQAQFIGKIKINPKGGDLLESDAKKIIDDPWGKELIKHGMLTIEDMNPANLKGPITETNAEKNATPGNLTEDKPEAKQGGR